MLAMHRGCSRAADPADPDPLAPKAHCRILDPERKGTEGVAQWWSRKGCERRCEELRRTGAKDCRWGAETLSIEAQLPEAAPEAPRDEAADPIHALEKRAADFAVGTATLRTQETREMRPMKAASAGGGGAEASAVPTLKAKTLPTATVAVPPPAHPSAPPADEAGEDADFEGRWGRIVTFRQEGYSTASRGGECLMTIMNTSAAAAKFKLEMELVAGKGIPLKHETRLEKIGNAKVKNCGAGICGTLRSGDGVTLIFEFEPSENADVVAGNPVCKGTIQAMDVESTPGFLTAAGTVVVVDTSAPIVVGEGRPF